MKEEKALLAGEMSGHIFFADRYLGFDDAIYASARLFEILARSDRPLSEMLSDLPPVVATPEIRVDCPDELKFRIAARVAEIVRPLAREVIDVDGVREASTRASGTVALEQGWHTIWIEWFSSDGEGR